MDLNHLQAMGAIATRTLVKKEIPIRRPETKPKQDWADPAVPEFVEPKTLVDDKLVTYIRKRSGADFVELMQAEDRHKPFVMILRCVCKADGSQVFESLEQVESLEEWLWIPLAAAAREVNQFGPKKSPPRTSSGASSRSPSAAGRSRSGKRRSAKKSARSGSPTGPSAAP